MTSKKVVDHGGSTTFIFEGKHNLIEVIRENSSYFSEQHNVIVVKGDGNIIKLYNRDIVDMSAPGSDTLVMVGDKEQYVMMVEGDIPLKTGFIPIVDTLQLNGEEIIISQAPQ